MELDPVTTGAIVIVAMGGFRLAEFAIKKISEKNGNGLNGKKQYDIDIALIKQDIQNIKDNHLHEIKEWMSKHDDEHKKDRELMMQIAYHVGIKKIEKSQ